MFKQQAINTLMFFRRKLSQTRDLQLHICSGIQYFLPTALATLITTLQSCIALNTLHIFMELHQIQK